LTTVPDDIHVLAEVIAALKALAPDVRDRVLQTAATYFGQGPSGHVARPRDAHDIAQPPIRFADDRTPSPKSFLAQKRPQTDVERIACLAHFLAHYRDMAAFKTVDLSALNTEAAQHKFSNPSMAVANAAKMGYVAPATKGHKQLSAAGKRYVEALPDRAAAKDAMSLMRPGRRGGGRPGRKRQAASKA
jgi:hypothetical protein